MFRKFGFFGFLFGSISAFGLFSCGLHDILDDSISETKMVEALQEALVLGSKTAASNLGDSSCEMKECVTGYLGNKLVEIAVPDTVKNVLSKINSFTNSLDPTAKSLLQTALGSQYGSILSLGKYGDSIKIALNRGAEQAAPASVDVFKNAIYGMSFTDAKDVLLGDSRAATSYLKNSTYSGLQGAFAPILEVPLKRLQLDGYWKQIASHYNSFARTYSNLASISGSALPGLPYEALPDDEDFSTYMAEYATGKALDGLFLMVGKQEEQLREDPWGTVSSLGDFVSDAVGDLLGDIFSKAKNNQL